MTEEQRARIEIAVLQSDRPHQNAARVRRQEETALPAWEARKCPVDSEAGIAVPSRDVTDRLRLLEARAEWLEARR